MELKSNDLHHLGKYTKELVNMGVYYLYTVKKTAKIKSTYILRTTDGYFYGLSSNGSIDFKEKEIKDGIILETVYFSDIKIPLIQVQTSFF